MPDNPSEFWWSQLEKVDNLRQRIDLALLMPDLTDKNRSILNDSLKKLDEREATARFQLGLPYNPPS